MRGPRLLTAVALVLLGLGCDRDQAAPEATAPTAEAGPEHKLAMRAASQKVLGDALRLAVTKSYHEAEQEQRAAARGGEGAVAGGPPSVEGLEVVSLLFSGNLHGEREDCGCKRNPMGGLDRRATLIGLDAAGGEEAATWWSGPLPAAARRATVVIDAGDLFFSSFSLSKANPSVQQRELTEAEAVAEALRLHPPDAFAVGERDLAMGRETLEALRTKGGFPFLSANLIDVRTGNQIYPGHAVVERQGQKVGLIALTQDRPHDPEHYTSRGLRAQPAAEAYLRELKRLPEDVDVVVALSNLGVSGTTKMVEEVIEGGGVIHAAIVSNTGRHTPQPLWVEGVPLVELMNRGKYFGRLDLYRRPGEGGRDRALRYGSASGSAVGDLRTYRSALTAYLGARRVRDQRAVELEQARLELHTAEGAMHSLEPQARRNLEARAQELEKMLGTLDNRVALLSHEVVARLAEVRAGEEARRGEEQASAWAAARLVALPLKVPQEPRTRRVLDRYKAKLAEIP